MRNLLTLIALMAFSSAFSPLRAIENVIDDKSRAVASVSLVIEPFFTAPIIERPLISRTIDLGKTRGISEPICDLCVLSNMPDGNYNLVLRGENAGPHFALRSDSNSGLVPYRLKLVSDKEIKELHPQTGEIRFSDRRAPVDRFKCPRREILLAEFLKAQGSVSGNQRFSGNLILLVEPSAG